MDWDRIEGNWKQFKRKAKERWGKLTDSDLAVIHGRRDRLEDKIHQRYGFAMEHVRKEVDDWVRCANPVSPGRSVLFSQRFTKIDAGALPGAGYRNASSR